MQRNTTDYSAPEFDIGGLQVPLWPRLAHFGLDAFETLSHRIGSLDPSFAEWQKALILAGSAPYLRFLNFITGASDHEIISALIDFHEDTKYHETMVQPLTDLDQIDNAGDLRFHSITLYVITRLIRPSTVIETGVAHGKSSASILLALRHNRRGRLISIDLRPSSNVPLADGSKTTLGGRGVGWLVPDYLRSRWELHDGDSLTFLSYPERMNFGENEKCDFFIHDSLHTFEHTSKELDAVSAYLAENAVVAVDNSEMASGRAFSEFLKQNSLIGASFRDFAATRT